MNQECIFCKIAQKEIPTDLLYEDDQAVAFRDIHPKAPVHLLIVPKEHITSVAHLKEQHTPLVGHLVHVAQKLAKDQGLEGYKLVFNVGREGGQIVDHIHLHLVGGWKSPEGQSQLTGAGL